MERSSPDDVTALLHEASDGNRDALDRLMPVVYDELRAIAHRQRSGREDDLATTTTALVHEAYLKLVDQRRVTWKNRAHFFALAARFIRRLLVDHARERLARKRGGDRVHVPLEDLEAVLPFDDDRAREFMELDEALDRLAELDERGSQVVVCRFFGGLSVEEAAEVLGISPATVKRDWSMARAWLHRDLTERRARPPDPADRAP